MLTTHGLVTVRTTSSRLPRKCLLPFGSGNVLEHVIRRAKHYGITPIVCTSVDPADDEIEALSKVEGVQWFRGSLVNKLKRWSDCAKHFGLRDFHTVDADDPFFDGAEMIRSLSYMRKHDFDMVTPTSASSAGAASVGYSLTADIVARASAGLDDAADTEMMWYLLEKVPGIRFQELPELGEPLRVRLTLDYPEDYWLLESVRRMVGNLASREEIDSLFRSNPDLYKINWFRNQEWKASQEAKRI